MNYEAVIFDMDGTLLDSIEDIALCMNRVLQNLGLKTFTGDEYKYLVGDGMLALAERAIPPDQWSEELVQHCFLGMKNEYAQHWADHTRPYPGIPELLDELTARGVKIAILSNKPDHFTQIMAEKLLADWQFNWVQGVNDGIPRKPDPHGALTIARMMNVAPDRVLYVGDTSTDMKTGVNAGMKTIGVLWGFRERAELIENGAEVIISQPLELLPLFDE